MLPLLRSLKLQSVVVAAICLDEDTDNIGETLSLALLERRSFDPLASSTWDVIPAGKTLITHVQCKSLWRQFQAETEYTISQAIATQEDSKRNNNWMPPAWAIVAMMVLGVNEFMTLLRNPLYIGVIFVGYLLVRALVQMDIYNEFRN